MANRLFNSIYRQTVSYSTAVNLYCD